MLPVTLANCCVKRVRLNPPVVEQNSQIGAEKRVLEAEDHRMDLAAWAAELSLGLADRNRVIWLGRTPNADSYQRLQTDPNVRSLAGPTIR